jgi:hypothetical protein
MKKTTLKNFVDAGYKKKSDAKNVNGYILDENLSTKRNKVYYDPNTGKAVHTIAGTDTLKDWSNNALIPIGLHQYSNRSKNSTKIQKKANEKYGKENVSLVSHSQSGHIAENLANKNLVGGQNTTLNPAIIGSHNKDIKVVKSILDPVSLLTNTNKNDLKIIPKTFNPITEHSTNIIDKTQKNIFHPIKHMFGHGLNSTKIQSILFKRPEWTLVKSKQWLKKHGYKYDVDKKPEHFRFRQFEPELFNKYRTKKIGDNIEFIIGIKTKDGNKSMKGKQYSDTDSEDHSEASSSEEEEEHELKGKGGFKSKFHEQDIIDRMAKLSHDIHMHHGEHGLKKAIIKGYKILGKGIVHSSKQCVTGGKINRSKKFNSWFKDIGNKFKPLNKNLSPIKHTMSEQASANIKSYTATPEQQAQSAVDLFNQVRGGNKYSTPSSQGSYLPNPSPLDTDYNVNYQPVIAQPISAMPYEAKAFDFNEQPSSYTRSYQPTGMSGFGLTFFDRKGGNDGKTHKEAMREKDNEKYTNDEAIHDARYTGNVYNKGGYNTNKIQKDMSGKGAIGKMLKKSAADATVRLLNSGTNRATHEMDTRNKSGSGLKKGSPEMKERMAKMRAMRKCNKA